MTEQQETEFEQLLEDWAKGAGPNPKRKAHLDEDRLIRYVSNQLSRGEKKRVISHLSSCGSCLRQLGWLESFVGHEVSENLITKNISSSSSSLERGDSQKDGEPENDPYEKEDFEGRSCSRERRWDRFSSRSHQILALGVKILLPPAAAILVLLEFFGRPTQSEFEQTKVELQREFRILSSLTAQSKVGEARLDKKQSVVGISIFDTVAHCSLRNGNQVAMDISNPSNINELMTYDPEFGDQNTENFLYENLLIMGHRFGGLNMYDVSDPANPQLLDSVDTNYHHAGLAVQEKGSQKWLYYSEHNAGTRPGGLLIYDISNNKLSLCGSNLIDDNVRDAGPLVVTNDDWVFQMDPAAGSSRNRGINIYNVSDKKNPTFDSRFELEFPHRAYSFDMKMSADENYLFLAAGEYGLYAVDIRDRRNLSIASNLSQAGYGIQELDFCTSDVLVASVSTPFGDDKVTAILVSNPTKPQFLPVFFGDSGYRIRDLDFSEGRLYLAVSPPGGGSSLQIWAESKPGSNLGNEQNFWFVENW